jgi:hypothetical protein
MIFRLTPQQDDEKIQAQAWPGLSSCGLNDTLLWVEACYGEMAGSVTDPDWPEECLILPTSTNLSNARRLIVDSDRQRCEPLSIIKSLQVNCYYYIILIAMALT